MTKASKPWLVIIDPQVIFAGAGSDWASPMWGDTVGRIRALADAHRGRTVVTRWVAPQQPSGSWKSYMKAWPFADRPSDDPAFDLVPELADLDAPVVSEFTFGKWTPSLRSIVGEQPHLIVCGVATDCCVISTVLPAADAGATITVVSDACAGSTPENHAAALQVMGLYPPQVRLSTTPDVLATLPG